MTTLGLKNVNMLSKEQYDTIAEPVKDELYAISGSGFGFPSDRYEDLELGASGTEYVAPANGYFFVSLGRSSNNWILNMNNTSNTMSVKGTTNMNNTTNAVVCHLFVKKGDKIIMNYGSGDIRVFRFIYAEGE